MATLKLAPFGTPRDELARTVDGEVPEWLHRLYASYGRTAGTAPARAPVRAPSEDLGFRLRKLAMLLDRMEALGWQIEPRQWDLLAHTDLDDVAAQAQLEEAGVWIIARLHAPLDAEGNVRWNHGLFA